MGTYEDEWSGIVERFFVRMITLKIPPQLKFRPFKVEWSIEPSIGDALDHLYLPQTVATQPITHLCDDGDGAPVTLIGFGLPPFMFRYLLNIVLLNAHCLVYGYLAGSIVPTEVK